MNKMNSDRFAIHLARHLYTCIKSLGPRHRQNGSAQGGQRIPRTVLIGLFGLCCLAPAAWGETLSKPNYGTAFFVSNEGHLVTSWHVIKNRELVYVGPLPSKKWAKARVLRVDPEKDLALLSTSRLRAQPLAIAAWSDVPIGLEVYAVGYPRPFMMGLSKKITQGIMNGDRNQSGDTGLFQFSAEIQQGNSGGPVLAPDGLVVGVAQRKLDALKIAEHSRDLPQNVNYAVKSSTLLEFLRESGIDARARQPDLNINPRPYQVYRQVEGAVFAVLAGDRPKANSADEPDIGEAE